MRVTIKQIAEKAGVSKSTVGRVVNNLPGVKPDTKKRVQEVIDNLGYEINTVGRGLKSYQYEPSEIAVISNSNTFFESVKKGINDAYNEIKDYNVKIEYYVSDTDDINSQISILNYLWSKRVSGIIIRPRFSEEIATLIDKIIADGIPVIAFNTNIPSKKLLCFIGQDLNAAGRIAGDLMGKLLCGKGKIAIITGSNDIWAFKQRIRGFKDVLSERFPSIEVADIIENYDIPQVTYEKTCELINTYEDIKGIYITAAGAGYLAKAIKDNNMVGEVKVISFDYDDTTINMIKEGLIDFTLGQEPQRQGYLSLKILFNYIISNMKPKNKTIYTNTNIKGIENLNDYIYEPR